MRVVFSVVSHNQDQYITKLIKSLEEFLEPSDYDVTIIVTHNTASFVPAVSSCFNVLNRFNLNRRGFGTNHNLAFEMTNPEIFVILNPDVELEHPFSLSDLAFAVSEKFVIASPVILDSDGNVEDYIRADLSLFNLLRRYTIERLFKYQERKFDWFAGVFLAFSNETYLKLRGFDERFFMYVEDCDICWRCKQQGGQLVSLEGRVVHLGQRSSRKKIKPLFWHLKSLSWYFVKKRMSKFKGRLNAYR
jgi:N-acetylglucosaminyl-diphospho-decaprenol L-rhamnosyltransferase